MTEKKANLVGEAATKAIHKTQFGLGRHILGPLGMLALAPLAIPAAIAGKATAKAVGGAGRGMVGIAAKAPMETAMGAGMVALPGTLDVFKPKPTRQAASQWLSSTIGEMPMQETFVKMNSVTQQAFLCELDEIEKAAQLPPGPYTQAVRDALPPAKGNVMARLSRSLPKEISATGEAISEKALAEGRKTTIGKLLLLGAALAAGSTLVGMGQQVAGYGIGRAVEKKRERDMPASFAAVLKADPGLRDEPRAREFYEVLHRASPYISSEPSIAAATVRSMIEMPPDERRLANILSVEKARQETRFPEGRIRSPEGKILDSRMIGESGKIS